MAYRRTHYRRGHFRRNRNGSYSYVRGTYVSGHDFDKRGNAGNGGSHGRLDGYRNYVWDSTQSSHTSNKDDSKAGFSNSQNNNIPSNEESFQLLHVFTDTSIVDLLFDFLMIIY